MINNKFLLDRRCCYHTFIASLFAVFLTSAASTWAAPITFQLDGEVTGVDSELTNGFYVGKPFTLRYTFDSEAPETGGSPRGTPSIGVFHYANAINKLIFDSGAQTFVARSGDITEDYADAMYFGSAKVLPGRGSVVNGYEPASVDFDWFYSHYHSWVYATEYTDQRLATHPRFVPDIAPTDICIDCALYDADGNALYDPTLGLTDLRSVYNGQPLFYWDGTPIPVVENNGSLDLVYQNVGGQSASVRGRLNSVRVIPSSPLDEKLLAFWPLHEGKGRSVSNYVANQYNGVIHNNPVWEENLLYFTGDDDYIDVGRLNVPGKALTLTAWVRSEDVRHCRYYGCRIITKSYHTSTPAQYWILNTVKVGNKVRLRFSLKTNGVTSDLFASSGDLYDNEWVHAAAVYDGSNMVLYKNGIEVGRKAKTGDIDTNSSVPVWIGGNPTYAHTRPWIGNIANVRVYQKALTVDEINVIRDYDRLSLPQ